MIPPDLIQMITLLQSWHNSPQVPGSARAAVCAAGAAPRLVHAAPQVPRSRGGPLVQEARGARPLDTRRVEELLITNRGLMSHLQQVSWDKSIVLLSYKLLVHL